MHTLHCPGGHQSDISSRRHQSTTVVSICLTSSVLLMFCLSFILSYVYFNHEKFNTELPGLVRNGSCVWYVGRLDSDCLMFYVLIKLFVYF